MPKAQTTIEDVIEWQRNTEAELDKGPEVTVYRAKFFLALIRTHPELDAMLEAGEVSPGDCLEACNLPRWPWFDLIWLDYRTDNNLWYVTMTGGGNPTYLEHVSALDGNEYRKRECIEIPEWLPEVETEREFRVRVKNFINDSTVESSPLV
jgi:hypothetical protein